MNAGYIGEQMELYLVFRNIGTLWFGIGKPDERNYDGLDYVIMIAVHKISDESLYRKDMFKAKRKPLGDIWEGETLDVAEIARFAPSACNTQPWFVGMSLMFMLWIVSLIYQKNPARKICLMQCVVIY